MRMVSHGPDLHFLPILASSFYPVYHVRPSPSVDASSSMKIKGQLHVFFSAPVVKGNYC